MSGQILTTLFEEPYKLDKHYFFTDQSLKKDFIDINMGATAVEINTLQENLHVNRLISR